MMLKSFGKSVRVVVLAATAAVVSACGFDGVELNGAVFDAVGLTGSTQQEEVKLKERQPLVVPPKMVALPAPDSASNPVTQLAEIKDHDAQDTKSAEQLAAEQKAFCDKNYDKNLALNNPELDNVSGPLGSCRQSVLSAINLNIGEAVRE